MSVGTTRPIGIRVGDELSGRCSMKLETMTERTLNVMENPFDKGHMTILGIMHVKTNLLNRIGYIGTCQS